MRRGKGIELTCRRSGDFREELFGFREMKSYRENRAKFRMEGEVLSVDGLLETILDAPDPELRAEPRWRNSQMPRRASFGCSTNATPALGDLAIRWRKWSATRTGGPPATATIRRRPPRRGAWAALRTTVNGAGQGDTQIDLLEDVGRVLGNADECYWTMQNGYAMPAGHR